MLFSHSNSGGTSAKAANCAGGSAGEGGATGFLSSVGIPDQLDLDWQFEQRPSPLGRENVSTAHKRQGEARAIGEGQSALLGLRIEFGAGARVSVIEGNDIDRRRLYPRSWH